MFRQSPGIQKMFVLQTKSMHFLFIRVSRDLETLKSFFFWYISEDTLTNGDSPYKFKCLLQKGNFLVFKASPTSAIFKNNQLKIMLMLKEHILALKVLLSFYYFLFLSLFPPHLSSFISHSLSLSQRFHSKVYRKDKKKFHFSPKV